MIRHLIRVVKSLVREHQKRTTRSPKWREVEKNWKREHASCAACGGTRLIQVHHVVPFHLHPELELDEKNLITLCMSKWECHIRIGHGDDFKAYNPDVRADAAMSLRRPLWRKRLAAMAKEKRLYDEPPTLDEAS